LTIFYLFHEAATAGAAVHVTAFMKGAASCGATVVAPFPLREEGPAASSRLHRRIPQWCRDLVLLALNIPRLVRCLILAARRPPAVILSRTTPFGCFELWLARLMDVPLVLEVNAPVAKERRRVQGEGLTALAGSIERLLWRSAGAICCVSEELGELVRAAGVNPRAVRVVPNGVDVELFTVRPEARARHRRGLDVTDEDRVITMVSGFRPWHGVQMVLDAALRWSSERRVVFLLIGEGPLLADARRFVAAHQLRHRVRFVGRVAHDDVPGYLAASDIALVPYESMGHFYYSPLKLFECMAAGTAIVATDIGQVSRILRDDETALLVPPGDRDALIAAIRRLADDDALRQRLATSAASLVHSQYTWRANAQAVIDAAQFAAAGTSELQTR
jgi:glycosyltransferase involved in cell wall biosynthesis